jgi:hypothetical protein
MWKPRWKQILNMPVCRAEEAIEELAPLLWRYRFAT